MDLGGTDMSATIIEFPASLDMEDGPTDEDLAAIEAEGNPYDDEDFYADPGFPDDEGYAYPDDE
jgi:hypothetical protein